MKRLAVEPHRGRGTSCADRAATLVEAIRQALGPIETLILRAE